jgi:glycosyltransferase involved in cell wall biosynthesis
MSRPFISFLTTAYQTERYVDETIQSVLAQTRTDWELIVVDNGNSDEMAGIVRKYTCDPRIRLLRQENKGIRGGVTAAADVAIGRYVCSLDSDDMLNQDFCERIGALIDAEPAIDAVSCDAELFPDPDDGGRPTGWFEGWTTVPDPSRPMSLSDMLNDGVPLYLGAFRREIWRALDAYDPATNDVEPDIEFWLRLAAAGRDIRVLPEKLARIRVRPGSSSRDATHIEEFENKYQNAFLAVSNHYPISEAAVSSGRMLRRLRYTQAMRRARWALLDGDVPGARTAARDAYHQYPTLHGAAIIVGLRLSPSVLKLIHPVKNRAQSALSRARFRIAAGRTL